MVIAAVAAAGKCLPCRRNGGRERPTAGVVSHRIGRALLGRRADSAPGECARLFGGLDDRHPQIAVGVDQLRGLLRSAQGAQHRPALVVDVRDRFGGQRQRHVTVARDQPLVAEAEAGDRASVQPRRR